MSAVDTSGMSGYTATTMAPTARAARIELIESRRRSDAARTTRGGERPAPSLLAKASGYLTYLRRRARK